MEQKLQQTAKLLNCAIQGTTSEIAGATKQVGKLLDDPKQREEFVGCLVKVLRTCENVQIRHMAAIIMKNNLPNGEPVLFNKLSPDCQAFLRKELMEAMASENNRGVARMIGTLLASMYSATAKQNPWKSFLPDVFSMWSQGNIVLCGTCCYVIRELFRTTDISVLEPHLKNVHHLLTQGFEQIGKMKKFGAAELSFIEDLSLCFYMAVQEMSDEHFGPFQTLITPSMGILGQMLGEQEFETAHQLFAGLVDCCMHSGMFWSSKMNVLCSMARQVCAAKGIADTLRQMALEVLCALGSDISLLARNNSDFVQTSVCCCLSLMLRLKDCEAKDSNGRPIDWCALERPPADFEDENLDAGEISLGRIGDCVKAQRIVRTAVPTLVTMIKDSCVPKDLQQLIYLEDSRQTWRFPFVGLIAMTQLAEFIPYEELPVDLVLSMLKSNVPRVRYAALNCLGQLGSDHYPRFQTDWHAKVVPALCEHCADKDHPRNQAHALSALFNFVEKLAPVTGAMAQGLDGDDEYDINQIGADYEDYYNEEEEETFCLAIKKQQGKQKEEQKKKVLSVKQVLQMYSRRIMDIALYCLKNGKLIVQQQALGTLACVGAADMDNFHHVYEESIKLMKTIIAKTANHSPQRGENAQYTQGVDGICALRNHAIEAVTTLGLNIGRDRFRKDAMELADMFYRIQQTAHVKTQLAAIEQMKKKSQISGVVNNTKNQNEGLRVTDPDNVIQYLLAAWSRLADLLQSDFAPHLPKVIGLVMSEVSKPVDAGYLEKHDAMIAAGETPLSMQFSDRGMSYFNSMEDKANALAMLSSLSQKCAFAFFPFLPRAMEVVEPLTRFKLREETCTIAATALPLFVKCAVRCLAERKRMESEGKSQSSSQGVSNARKVAANVLGKYSLKQVSNMAVGVMQTSMQILVAMLMSSCERGMESAEPDELLRLTIESFNTILRINVTIARMAIEKKVVDKAVETIVNLLNQSNERSEKRNRKHLQVMKVHAQINQTEGGQQVEYVSESTQGKTMDQIALMTGFDSKEDLVKVYSPEELAALQSGGGMDDAFVGELRSMEILEDRLGFTLTECMGAMMIVLAENFVPYFDGLLDPLLKMNGPAPVFIVCDVFRHLGNRGHKYFSTLLPWLCQKMTNSANDSIRQGAAFSLGVAAAFGKRTFVQFIDPVLDNLFGMLNKVKDPETMDDFLVIDNIKSAIVKIMRFYPKQFCESKKHGGAPEKIGSTLLALLPMNEDPDEAQLIYSYLMGMLQRGDARFTGSNMSNLPRIVTVLSQSLQSDILNGLLVEPVYFDDMVDGDGFRVPQPRKADASNPNATDITRKALEAQAKVKKNSVKLQQIVIDYLGSLSKNKQLAESLVKAVDQNTQSVLQQIWG